MHEDELRRELPAAFAKLYYAADAATREIEGKRGARTAAETELVSALVEVEKWIERAMQTGGR